MEPSGAPVEEILVLRVVDEARRRRVRRIVALGVVSVVTAGGLAIALTHRSAAEPTARSVPVATDERAPRTEILAVAAARYASAVQRGPHRTHAEFGRLTLTGDHARLQVSIVCVPLCGHGEEVSFSYQDGAWRVTSTRITWLS